MSEGNRTAAAEFVLRYGPMIRRRIRGKMRAAMRRLFDSQDIMSTLGRRLDAYVHDGRFSATSEAELWALVFKIAENSIADKARIFTALQEKEGEDSPFAHMLLSRLKTADAAGAGHAEDEMDYLLDSLDNPIDRRIAVLWATGHTHVAIAEELGIDTTIVRKRWERTKDKLRVIYQEQAA